ncbi:PREDICTED: receptor-type tyrosine-protein phosphatase epsilon-like [Amphimedon queenslandica]|uniref:Tyrosine-protein phosphatase domain-containing protein n=1 Tax=Amphimedon queenslandica TaxID=400682 RepID=A0AAN0JP11_AMPQE|nr:PREDICTED: receptor-type tyrosine-protein phosphatase epsilon-like [Amphimedon queenslandica]|eukprot:XP_019858754.1 PREDICTED: receptor-type tyrosine-protein phosphatase epsilon-like [Amphimedon queenslandica]
MLSKTADNAYPSTLDLEAVNEKAELREFASLQNGNVEHEEEEEETVAYPEVIPEEERMKPIPRSAFSQHVKEMHREREKGFELEYHSLASPKVYPHFIAKLDCNGPKNRFANIYPFDDSRVVLSVLDGIEGSDYINASFIDGYNRQNAYIAAQGTGIQSFIL